MNLTSDRADSLLKSQLEAWDQAKVNYEALKSVKTKEFDFGRFQIKVQFNPERIRSSAAKVDAKSISERKCFLCPSNLPPVQEGIPFLDEYHVLINPFPIFERHFTVPTYEHTDQLIKDKFIDMLDLAKALDEYTIFYNGPKCGASAPDHAHFQAGNKGFMPIETDVRNINKNLIIKEENILIFQISNYLRNCFYIQAKDKPVADIYFKKIYDLLPSSESETEPMMNLLAWYEDKTWHICIFPRQKHRPSCYYAEGANNILISPASVDLGGVMITPLEKDFDKITATDISNIFSEICLPQIEMSKIILELTK